jgi:hypothetical protein
MAGKAQLEPGSRGSNPTCNILIHLMKYFHYQLQNCRTEVLRPLKPPSTLFQQEGYHFTGLTRHMIGSTISILSMNLFNISFNINGIVCHLRLV